MLMAVGTTGLAYPSSSHSVVPSFDDGAQALLVAGAPIADFAGSEPSSLLAVASMAHCFGDPAVRGWVIKTVAVAL